MFSRGILSVVLGLGLILGGAMAVAQEKKDPGRPTTQPAGGQGEKQPAAPKPGAAATTKPGGGPAGEMPPEMQAMMEAMQPGPMHAKLTKLAGEWTNKSKMVAPGAPPEETEGTTKITVVMDGRFIHHEDSGTMMGMPFKSARLMGYNNGSKKYEAVWIYTMGTGMMTMKGTSDDQGKTIKFDATFDNEIGVTEKVTITYKFADEDHFTIVLDGGKMPDGSPGPVMETSYTRKK